MLVSIAWAYFPENSKAANLEPSVIPMKYPALASTLLLCFIYFFGILTWCRLALNSARGWQWP